MNWMSKRMHQAANLAIILVVLMIGVVFAKNYLFSPHRAPGVRDYRIPAGTRVSLPGIDWKQNGQTLLLVLQKGCRYCTDSAPFYRQLAHEAAANSRVRLLAVLPQEVAESKQYLISLNLPIDEVRHAELEALGVQGTPTLILVNGKGEVLESWVGRLSAETESEVLRRIDESVSQGPVSSRLTQR